MFTRLHHVNNSFMILPSRRPEMARFDTGLERFVVWLNQEQANRALVGGKAASLSQLAGFNAPVPRAFALTVHAYAEFASLYDFPSRAADIAVDDLPELRARIMEAPLPHAISLALAQGYQVFEESLGAEIALAVRSSGTAEDSVAFSFAGLHDTVLDVRSLSSLEAAVRECWASLWSERAVAYRLENNLASDASEIAVIVQQLVRSDVSFVAFTADPVGQYKDSVVIDATWGLGEAIVSGLVVPDHVSIAADGQLLEYRVGDKQVMVIPGGSDGNGTREVPVPRSLRTVPALTVDQARAIARLARDVSRQLQFEADLEGGIVGGEIHLFQARPITTLTSGTVSHQ
jgi:pyruvate,water dikinase